jgi:PPOX class probable F420-dependent enzyme
MNAKRGLTLVSSYGVAEEWLAVLTTMRSDGRPSVSVVNAGIVAHPVTGETMLGFVARGATAKLTNLRRTPDAVLTFRHGWEWVAVHGTTELVGPDDPLEGVTPEARRQLLRDIYTAAGGRHPDLDEYDRAMVAERRAAVLLRPARFTSNPPGTEHKEHE